jgi:hypothetical protein
MLPSSRPYTSPPPPPLSVEDQVIQRQPQSPLKKDAIALTHDCTQVFLQPSLTLANEKSRMDGPCKSNKHLDHTISPTSVGTFKKIIEPIETKRQVAFKRQTLGPRMGEYHQQQHQQQHQQHHHQQQQLQNQLQQHQLQQHQLQQHQLQLQHHQLQHAHLQNKQHNQQHEQESEFACLYPRDDQRSRVRFNPSLSVYDNFQYYHYDDDVHDNIPEITDEKTTTVHKEKGGWNLFWLDRARRCWYSREELKMIKNERKEIVRALKKVNFDVRCIDTSMHELRGFECYLSVSSIFPLLSSFLS